MGGALSLPQARRIALAAQGLIHTRPTAFATARAVGRVFARLQLVQIDSVNVLVRSHYLPFFSRLGPYDRAALDRLGDRSPRKMIEYWAHEASFVKPEHFDALRLWQKRSWAGAARLEPKVRDELAARILDVLASSRPLTSAQLTERLGHVEERRTDNWGWNWNAVKRVLGDLFEQGVVSSAGRTPSFERRYALTSSVLPANSRASARGPSQNRASAPGPSQMDHHEAALILTGAALRAHGIGTARCIADYFRLPVKATEQALSDLVRWGEAEVVSVTGWGNRLYKDAAASVPRGAASRALLSPFDSLVFERRRLERLFDFHYRIEIYTPAARRRFGYYVLPFLLGDAMVARVDLKADRANGILLVQGVHREPEAPPETAAELAAELRLLADWLNLDDVWVAENGSLAAAVARSLGHTRRGNPDSLPSVSPVD